MQLYAWQQTAIDKLKVSKNLLVQAPPGAGKSFIGLVISESIDKDVLVIAPSLVISNQWKEKYGIDSTTIQTAIKFKNIKRSVIILDECHHYESKRWSEIYKIVNCTYLLGFSATPGESTKRFGDKLVVKWEDIDYPPISFKFHTFDLDAQTRIQYQLVTDKITNIIKRQEEMEVREFDQLLLMLSMERRRLIFNSQARFDAVVNDFMGMVGTYTLIVCETIEQADKLSEVLNVPAYHSKSPNNSDFDEFKRGESNLLISVKMLGEGFDLPKLDTIVLVSSAMTDTHIVQTIGRAMRKQIDKVVTIHVFMANDTTDMKLKPLCEGITTDKDTKESLDFKWKCGIEYSLDSRMKIFQRKQPYGRKYFESTNGVESKIREIKRLGGKFKLYKNEVLVRDSNKVVSCGITELLEIPEKDMTNDEMRDFIFGA